MKKLFVILLFLFLPFVAFAQTLQQIQEEENPNYIETVDNSEFAQLWRQQVEARKIGDVETSDRIGAEIRSKFPEKFYRTNENNVPLRVAYTDSKPPFNPVTPDWGGDILVSNNNVSAPTVGNPTPYARMVKVESDTAGRLYLSYLNLSRDTLYIYKSIDNGTNWTVLQKVLTGVDYRIHSFDFYVTDSVNVFRLGFAISVVPTVGTGYEGSIYWVTFMDNGMGARLVQTFPYSDKGFTAPAIVSDGYVRDAATTNWYMTFQGVNPTTGAGTIALMQYTTDWGYTWLLDTARNTYNDYDLDIDYSFNGDSLYVLMTNNLTTTNPNLRLRYIGIAALGTTLAFKQFNPASTSLPEYSGSLAANRQTNAIVVTYTQSTSGLEDIYYSYAVDGIVSSSVVGVPIANNPNNENYSSVDCHVSQGAYRLAYRSVGTGYDTVIYMNTLSLPSGFANRQVVNETNNSSADIAPDIVGRYGSGGVAFAGVGNYKVWYDGSDIFTNITSPKGVIPENYSLGQNYPNPFNPVTNINFSLPVNTFVTLKIYDITGREVKELVNGQLNAGVYNYTFDASGLSSGVYLYKIIAGDFVSVKKMTLIK